MCHALIWFPRHLDWNSPPVWRVSRRNSQWILLMLFRWEKDKSVVWYVQSFYKWIFRDKQEFFHQFLFTREMRVLAFRSSMTFWTDINLEKWNSFLIAHIPLFVTTQKADFIHIFASVLPCYLQLLAADFPVSFGCLYVIFYRFLVYRFWWRYDSWGLSA